jgi:hypothetical protein
VANDFSGGGARECQHGAASAERNRTIAAVEPMFVAHNHAHGRRHETHVSCGTALAGVIRNNIGRG